MSRFGMYTKGTNEGGQHIAVVDVSTKKEAEAYFAGVKRLSLEQFRNLFDVREVKEDSKNLLLG